MTTDEAIEELRDIADAAKEAVEDGYHADQVGVEIGFDGVRAIDAILAALAASEARAERAWVKDGTPPPVAMGGCAEYLVAVCGPKGHRYTTTAVYLNGFALDEWDGDDDESRRTGWHDSGPTPSYDEYFIPMTGVYAWAEKPPAPAAGTPATGEVV